MVYIYIYCWQTGKTPLHAAIEKGKLDVAQLLLQSGANLEAQDKVRGLEAFE